MENRHKIILSGNQIYKEAELAAALNEAYGLGVDLSDINNCYLKAQNPIMLLKGNRTLKEFGVRNGTIISMAE